jgi:hypothetical protein
MQPTVGAVEVMGVWDSHRTLGRVHQITRDAGVHAVEVVEEIEKPCFNKDGTKYCI